jgi:hypothetical protein
MVASSAARSETRPESFGGWDGGDERGGTLVAQGDLDCLAQGVDRYTIMDFRALAALGVKTGDRSLPFYLEYLEFCIQQARGWEMSLRKFDRAFWQWSKEQ